MPAPALLALAPLAADLIVMLIDRAMGSKNGPQKKPVSQTMLTTALHAAAAAASQDLPEQKELAAIVDANIEGSVARLNAQGALKGHDTALPVESATAGVYVVRGTVTRI